MFDQNIINYSVITILVLVSLYLVLCLCTDNFNDISPPGITNTYVKTVSTIPEQENMNKKFMENYKEYENKTKDEKPYMWNENNSLESMNLFPCLGDGSNTDRMTCYTAPPWWYPFNKYDSKQFREVYYGDYFNPIYNYLGNAQEMYWDFKTVRNS